MTTIYHLDGMGDPHGGDHVRFSFTEKMEKQKRLYWKRLKRDFVSTLPGGATLKDFAVIEDPEYAFPSETIEFTKEPFVVPDILIGPMWTRVTEKAKSVIEAIDPGVNAFYRLKIVDADGSPWEQQALYAMLVRRVVMFPNVMSVDVGRVVMPEDESGGCPPQLSFAEETPGLPTELVKYPIWQHEFGASRPFWNETMMQAFRDAGLTGIKLMVRDNEMDIGQAVNRIWFRELAKSCRESSVHLSPICSPARISVNSIH